MNELNEKKNYVYEFELLANWAFLSIRWAFVLCFFNPLKKNHFVRVKKKIKIKKKVESKKCFGILRKRATKRANQLAITVLWSGVVVRKNCTVKVVLFMLQFQKVIRYNLDHMLPTYSSNHDALTAILVKLRPETDTYLCDPLHVGTR